MTQGFKKVAPGQPYHGFPANLYNAIVDVVNAYRGGELTFRNNAFDTARSSGIIQLKNATGGTLNRLSVVGLSDPIFTPDNDQNEFRNRVRFDGITPTSEHEPDRFAILVQPLQANEVGLAVVAGVTSASVYIEDAKHEFATVEQSATSYLVSTPDRGAQILWKETGIGLKDCIIRMPCPPQVAIVELTDGSCDAPQEDNSDCVWQASICEVNVTGASLCDPWQTIASPDCYVVATNECEDLTKMKLRGGERFVGVRVGQWGTAGSELPLYAIMAPHGKVRVDEDDKLDYLEDQCEDLEASPGYGDGDLLINVQNDDVGGDKQLRWYVNIDDYDQTKEQALTHAVSDDQPKWVEIVEVEVVTDLRLYNGLIEKRTNKIKVLAQSDQGWTEALPTTEC